MTFQEHNIKKLHKNLRHIYVLSAHGQCIISKDKLIKRTIPDNLYIIFTCPLGCVINNTPKPLNRYFKNILNFVYKGNLSKMSYATILAPGDKYPDLNITTNNNITHKGYHHMNLNSKTIETVFGKYVSIDNTLSNIVGNYTNNINSNNVGILVVDTCRTIEVNDLFTKSNQGFINRDSNTNKKTQSKFFIPRRHSIKMLQNIANNISRQQKQEGVRTQKIIDSMAMNISAAKKIQKGYRKKSKVKTRGIIKKKTK